MIKIILFILFLGYSITGIYAQEITHTVVPIGKNYTTGKIVEGQKIVFPQEVLLKESSFPISLLKSR